MPHHAMWRPAKRMFAAGAVILCAACAKSPEARIVDACMKATAQAAAENASARAAACDCFARSAERNLDKRDYELLASVSAIYMSDETRPRKLQETVNLFENSGMTAARAGISAMDLFFLADSLNRECRV